MQKTYSITPEKIEEYYTRYKKRGSINTILSIGWIICVLIGIRFNMALLPAIGFAIVLLLTILLRLGLRRRSWGIIKDETYEYLFSSFVLTETGLERIYKGKTVANVRFKSKYTFTESRWGIEIRNYSFLKNRPFEKASAEVSDRMYLNFDSYYRIFIPTAVDGYDELRQQLYLKLPATKV